MPPLKRAAVLFLFAVAVATIPAAALAGDDGLLLATEGPTEGEGTQAPTNESGVTPAEEAPQPEPDEPDQPWTARFLAPLVLTLGIAGLVISATAYVVRVKSRYQVVE